MSCGGITYSKGRLLRSWEICPELYQPRLNIAVIAVVDHTLAENGTRGAILGSAVSDTTREALTTAECFQNHRKMCIYIKLTRATWKKT